jgi:hypothetical protein
MRPSAIPLIGAIALSIALPSTGDGRARFGPAAALRTVAGSLGATLGGSRRSLAKRHHRAKLAHTSNERRAEPAVSVEPPSVIAAQFNNNAPTDRRVFWPYASDDLLEYAFFPSGKEERFWAYGFDTILHSAFASRDAIPARRSRRSDGAAAEGRNTDGSDAADPCGSGRAADSADGVIERIAQAIRPTAPQRDMLEELRTALARAIERIKSACPAIAPTTLAERLKAIQDRIGAMRDALLTIRLPFEQLNGSLSDEQLWRLASVDPDATEGAATTGSTTSTATTCGDQAGGGVNWPIHAIERVVRPSAQQRAMLQGLQMRLAGMAQLVGSSCPDYPLLGAMDRFAAASDRLDVMLFALLTLSPALPDFYASLSDKQKAALDRVVRHFRRTLF